MSLPLIINIACSPVNSGVGLFPVHQGTSAEISYGDKFMKCQQCGLVNFKDESLCKRCGAPLAADSQASPVHDTTKVWRDSALLVMTENSVFPMRCLRCNASSSVAQRKVVIDYYRAYNLATRLIGYRRWTRFTLGLPLCRKHNLSRAASIVLGMLIIFVGLGVVVAGFGYNLQMLLYVGLIVIISGFVVAAVKGSPISVQKIEEPYFWLRGIDGSYLASLPQWRK
jgi:hypothetical protein